MRNVFELLTEMGATVDHDVGRFVVQLSDGRGLVYPANACWVDDLPDVIRWAKDVVPGEWCVVMSRTEVDRLWRSIPRDLQLHLRVFRPRDAPLGWVMSLSGVDIVEERVGRA